MGFGFSILSDADILPVKSTNISEKLE